MNPLEHILQHTEQKSAYEFLSKHFDDIIPFAGTGSSFYCKSWGAPFQDIFDSIKNSEYVSDKCFTEILTSDQKCLADTVLPRALTEEQKIKLVTLEQCLQATISYINQNSDEQYRIEDLPREKGAINKTKAIWNYLSLLLKAQKFLELGELLNIISYTLLGKTFNELFQKAISDYCETAREIQKNEEKTIENLHVLGSKKFPSSQWFLPFFGEKSHLVITTNTDETLQWVYSYVFDHHPRQYNGYDKRTIIESCREEIANESCSRIVYHIHGYQKENKARNNTSGTFIMTWSDYWEAYKSGDNTSSMRMLEECFMNEYLLFIGAGLDQDETAKVMKKVARKEGAMDKHVAFFKRDTIDARSKAIQLSEMATQLMCFQEFDDYSVVLCQLIREKRNKEWNILHTIYKNAEKTNADWQNKLDNFLNCGDSYKMFDEPICEQDLDKYIYPVIRQHIFGSNGKRTYQWSICRIDCNEFEFPIKVEQKNAKFEKVYLDSYSAPLGNTIYIIGGEHCSQDNIEELIKRIRKWVENHGTNYWNRKHVKVRIIQLSATGYLSPAKVIDRLNEITQQNESQAEENFLNLIKELNKYSEYLSVFPSYLLNFDLDFFRLGMGNVYEWVHALCIILAASQIFMTHINELLETKQNAENQIAASMTVVDHPKVLTYGYAYTQEEERT